MGDLREQGGGAAAAVESPLGSLSTSITSNSSPPPSIGPESWGRAEKAIQKIILKVQPTKLSEERRKEVIEYVQRLMKSCNGCEVFPYGSVPLKTYLPDGDIDLTAFGGTTSEEELAEDIVSALGGEEQNKAAEFVVKDVQLIRAEVKLVKCIIQNIVVDISFNQIGGLCTLCFLEKVDRLIGKDHLFKRSIILIKAWCYYESRILGAHHGLISTYALETLVLYIFHLFHSSLNGPLSVLYKFLDYFSQFDWENYCISLSGPVRLSSLPEFVVETPDNGGGNLLLTSEFLGYCAETYSAVPSRGVDLNSRTFQQKFLNIVDPLKENNNLGRSISKGNFFRIRSAFTYGARKLGQILMEPQDDIDEGLSKFFFNMLGRHGSGQRPDVLQVPPHGSSNNGFGPALVVSKADSCPTENVIPETESMSYTGTSQNCRSGSKVSSHNAISYMKVSGGENHIKNNEVRDGYAKLLPHNMFHKADRNAMGKALDDRIFGDAKDLATSRFESLQISSGFSEYPDFAQESAVPVARPYYIPHLYFSNPMLSDGDKGTNNSHRVQIENSQNNRYSGGSRWSDRDHGFGLEKDIISREDDIVVPAEFKDVHLAKSKVLLPENFYHGNLGSATPSARTPESLNPVADLCGDYEAHYNSLLYGRASTQYAVGTSSWPINAAPASVFQMQNSLDGAQQQYQFVQNGFSHVSMHGVVSSPAFYMANQILIPGVAFGLEEMPKPRGTGTYLPNMNRPLLGYRPPSARGRNQAPSRSPRNNNRNVGFMDNNVTDRGSHEVSYDQSGPKSGTSDINPSFSPRGKVNPNANAFVLQSHGGFEHSSAGHATEAPLFERRKQRHQKSQSITSPPQNSSPVSSPSGMERSKPVLSRDYDRFSMKSSYRLKDDDDFPPLSL